MPSEDSTCAICDDSEGENSNAIVFCDGCNLAVHQGHFAFPEDLLRRLTLRCYRLLWCSIHPRRPVALSQMHRFPREPCGSYPFVQPYPIATQHHLVSNACCVQTKEALSNRPCMENGCICYVPYGSLRQESPTKCSWSQLRVTFQSSGGNSCVFFENGKAL